jgi:hypothetical protein
LAFGACNLVFPVYPDLGPQVMKKNFIPSSILILMVLIFIGPSSSEETPVWWPTALAEAQQDGYVLTTPQELRELYDSGGNFTVVDVRPDYEFNTGHLPEAKNFEIDIGDRLELKPQKAEAFKNVIGSDKDRVIVIYCRSFR